MAKKLIFVIFALCITGCRTTGAYLEGQYVVTTLPDVYKEIFVTNTSYDPETGELAYTLPEDALVRIRIGIKDGGPLLLNWLDWEKQPAGDYYLVWDKMDSSGKISFADRRDITLVLSARSEEMIPAKSRQPLFTGFKKSPEFQVEFPKATRFNDDGIPVVKGVTPIRIAVDKKDYQWLVNTKFEIGLFIDYIFLMEDEEGNNPFTYQLDTTRMNDGKHLITVNVISYKGEIGTKSFYIEVGKNES